MKFVHQDSSRLCIKSAQSKQTPFCVVRYAVEPKQIGHGKTVVTNPTNFDAGSAASALAPESYVQKPVLLPWRLEDEKVIVAYVDDPIDRFRG
ncbi:hypothetical protein Pla52o_48760 [Novipirellula galeiformis]|uniref:Uncharacterized protein n=1 Tax=Novipirellula galeiformis TaxID=2528004 RepID=A0A5C6C1Z5_9BACT|nr:hypothetical protein Pla52o_48760 [Novipirellula galeiformis]